MKIDTKYYKTALEKELAILESDLSSIGRKNPGNKNDWEPATDQMDIDRADENEVADAIESFESNTAIMSKLEPRFNEVKLALERIENGTFGNCTVCHKPIEQDRLEANSAATTCIKDMGK